MQNPKTGRYTRCRMHGGVPLDPERGRVGHGFKFCSVVREIMTDLAFGGPFKRWDDLRLFRLKRFNPHLS